MNLLYIGYWGVNEGLSLATIKPHLEVLVKFKEIKSIYFVTIERNLVNVDFDWEIPKVKHIPLYSSDNLKSKFSDFTNIPIKLAELSRKNNCNYILCRSSLAGAIGYLVHQKTGLKYSVESFEPHSEYMRAAGVWKSWDPRYWLQRYFEMRQLRTADYIFPVSNNFKDFLKDKKRKIDRIDVISCSVDFDKFKFNFKKREIFRRKLGIQQGQVAFIYAGKFGDIYYDEEALNFIKSVILSTEESFFILLTSHPISDLKSQLVIRGVDLNRIAIDFVDHDEVPNYLSAADVAVSFVKETRWSFACSPVKTGEYWANGLPTIMEKGIGDDSDFIMQINPSLIVNLRESYILPQDLKKLTVENRERNDFTDLARNERSPDKYIYSVSQIFK